MCENHDVRVIYLSLYSSDYNSIEEFFSMLKKWYKRYYEAYEIEESFIDFLRMSIDASSKEELAKQHFRHVEISVQ